VSQKCARLAPQHVSFEPICSGAIPSWGFVRHPTARLVQPVGGPVLPPPRLVGLAHHLAGERQLTGPAGTPVGDNDKQASNEKLVP
jgi:hypothetical protein